MRLVPPGAARAGDGGPPAAVLRPGLPAARLRAALGDGEGRSARRRRARLAGGARRPPGPAVPAALRTGGRPDAADRAAHEGRPRAPARRAAALHRAPGPSLGHRADELRPPARFSGSPPADGSVRVLAVVVLVLGVAAVRVAVVRHVA